MSGGRRTKRRRRRKKEKRYSPKQALTSFLSQSLLPHTLKLVSVDLPSLPLSLPSPSMSLSFSLTPLPVLFHSLHVMLCRCDSVCTVCVSHVVEKGRGGEEQESKQREGPHVCVPLILSHESHTFWCCFLSLVAGYSEVWTVTRLRNMVTPAVVLNMHKPPQQRTAGCSNSPHHPACSFLFYPLLVQRWSDVEWEEQQDVRAQISEMEGQFRCTLTDTIC